MKFCTWSVFFAFVFCLVSSQEDILPSEDDDGSLSSDPSRTFVDALLSSGYDPGTLPTGNDGEGSPVEVLTTMYVLDIQKVDDLSMDFTAQFYFRQAWNDSRLQYEGQEKYKILLRDVSHIWTPDLFFIEEKQGRLLKLMGPNVFCRIRPNGEVLFSTRLSMTFRCPMDLRRYPHDVQKCVFNIESYGLDRSMIEIGWDHRKIDPVSASSELSLYEFEMIDITPSKKEHSFHFGNYSSLQVNFIFQRKTGFFVTRLFVPFILLVLLSCLSFWINAKEKTLRLSLLFAILYLMSNISSDVNFYVPPVPYTKGSDVWIAVCQSFVFASFLEFIVVSILQKERKIVVESHEKDLEAAGKTDHDSTFSGRTRDTLDSMVGFVAKRLKGYPASHPIDRICRWLYPVFFVIFCVLYALIYCT